MSCKCELYQIESLVDIFSKLTSALDKNRGKKIGTIFISGHGSRKSLSIPVAKGMPIVSVDMMISALELGFSLSKKPPKGWSQNLWNQYKPGFFLLNNELAMYMKRILGRFDASSLIRFWVCFLGFKSSNLQTIGRLFVPNDAVTIEAPKVRSVAYIQGWGGSKKGAFKHLGKKRYRHPDITVEVLSDKNGIKFLGQDRSDAMNNFDDDFVQNTKIRSVNKWYPVFGLEYKIKKYVYPGQYKKFRKYWTTKAQVQVESVACVQWGTRLIRN